MQLLGRCSIIIVVKLFAYIIYYLFVAPLNSLQPSVSARRRRSLLAVNLTTASPAAANEIRNPLICLEQDDTIAFKVYINEDDRTLSNYPVYVKDHLYK